MLQEQRQKAKTIQEHVARAKGYLRRGELVKSIDSAMTALKMNKCVKLLGKEKIETNYALEEFCRDFSSNTDVIQFLESINVTVKPIIVYAPGKEVNIAERMALIRKGLVKLEEAKEGKAKERLEARKKHLFGTGRDAFESKNYPKGRSYLRKAAEEYPDEADMLLDIARLFLKHDFPSDCFEVLEQVLERHPTRAEAYSMATKALLMEERFEKAEEVYLAAIKQFGRHPMTLLNMSKMYLDWRKKDKAFDAAKEALDADPSLEEAREIVEKTA